MKKLYSGNIVVTAKVRLQIDIETNKQPNKKEMLALLEDPNNYLVIVDEEFLDITTVDEVDLEEQEVKDEE